MTALPEPAVLAAAKETLYPATDEREKHYAVTETQFTQSTWGGWEIPDSVRERLAPYNTIRLTGGEPDLLGVGVPDIPVRDAEAADTPVIIVEAKGDNTDPSAADVSQGITQAHAHLAEANIGFVAAPRQSIDDADRALAREVNVGLIGAESAQTAAVLEPPRVTGAGDVTQAIDAIRLQASSHRFTEASFPLNHPKNYLGYALAVGAAEPTAEIFSEHVIDDVDGARRGAALLDLVDLGAESPGLTHTGAEVVRFAGAQYGSVEDALAKFAQWSGRRTRFTDLAPRWAQLARSVIVQYEPTRLLVEVLERLHADGIRPATIDELAWQACQINQPLAVEVLFTQSERADVLTSAGEIDETVLRDPRVYKSGLHFQFKAMLYHVGLVTDRGTDQKAAVLSDNWTLEDTVR